MCVSPPPAAAAAVPSNEGWRPLATLHQSQSVHHEDDLHDDDLHDDDLHDDDQHDDDQHGGVEEDQHDLDDDVALGSQYCVFKFCKQCVPKFSNIVCFKFCN